MAGPLSSGTPVTVGDGPSTHMSGAIIGAVVSAVVVLVGGSVVVAASLIAWKVRSTKASTGMHCTVVHICLCDIYSKTYNVTQCVQGSKSSE